MACFCGIPCLSASSVVKGIKFLPDDGECDTETRVSNTINACNE